MGSQGSGRNSIGGTQIRPQDPESNALARFCSLTLDEVQSRLGDLGKPLSSMNLDELLQTVWTAETNNQVISGSRYSTSAHLQPSHPVPGLPLNRQLGLTVSGNLSKKTVDDVWQDIQEQHKKSSLERAATLGEMTLEDFLVKAGVVANSSPGKKYPTWAVGEVDSVGMPQQRPWMNYRVPSIHPQQQPQVMMPVYMPHHPAPQSVPLARNPVVDGAYHETQVTISSAPLMGTWSDTQSTRRKRVSPSDIAEKSVERRHKRMIKNRESAARSRARKLAYTNELERKVMHLEEENERLRRLQVLEKALHNIVPAKQPEYQLRRTSSAPMSTYYYVDFV